MTENRQDRSRRILWVEDDYHHLKNLLWRLEEMGYEVVPALSIVEAKSLLVEWQSFSAVLLDLIVPYSPCDALPPDASDAKTIEGLAQNGLALFDYMVDELKMDIPIIVVSVVAHEGVVASLTARGATRRFVKLGVRPSELADTVVKAIDERGESLT